MNGNVDGATVGEHEVTIIYTDQKPNVTKDPVAAVPGADALVVRRTDAEDSGKVRHVGAFINSLSFDDASRDQYGIDQCVQPATDKGVVDGANRGQHLSI